MYCIPRYWTSGTELYWTLYAVFEAVSLAPVEIGVHSSLIYYCSFVCDIDNQWGSHKNSTTGWDRFTFHHHDDKSRKRSTAASFDSRTFRVFIAMWSTVNTWRWGISRRRHTQAFDGGRLLCKKSTRINVRRRVSVYIINRLFVWRLNSIDRTTSNICVYTRNRWVDKAMDSSWGSCQPFLLFWRNLEVSDFHSTLPTSTGGTYPATWQFRELT